MVDREIEVRLLTLEDGKCPFEEWYESLRDRPTRARIAARLARVRAGNLGDARSVGEGVSELRLDFGPGYRIYFGQVGQRLVVLIVGGDKSTQSRDVQRAQQFWKDYQDASERFQRDFRP